MIVRSVHFGFEVPDTDASMATLYYAADEGALDAARLTGLVAADRSRSPWPLVIVLPGINVPPDSYRWLAIRLVRAGYCVATYANIGSLGPAGRGITPGIDLAAFGPDIIASHCSATALGPLLDAIADLDEPVRGLIDFDRVAIGGHSAGGTVALHNTDPSWVSGLACAFSFGGHTMTSMSLGHGEASITAVPSKVPILLLTGADDGVVARRLCGAVACLSRTPAVYAKLVKNGVVAAVVAAIGRYPSFLAWRMSELFGWSVDR